MEALRKRISKHLDIQVLNIVYEVIETGSHERKPRLSVIVDSEADIKKIRRDRLFPKKDVTEYIQKEFVSIITQMDLLDTYDTKNIFIVFDYFTKEAIIQTIRKFLQNDASTLQNQWPPDCIWRFDGPFNYVVVFFKNEKEKQAAAENGDQTKIYQECYRLVKQYDEFDLVTLEEFSVVFDSKENLDQHYQGNLYYYFK